MTYPLLGLIDVSMVPNYGEGSRAFRRLQQKILMDGDLSILAWQPGQDTSALFATSPTDFHRMGWIELRPSQSGGSERSLSNAGLIRYMFLTTSPNGIATAFLDCGVQDDPDGMKG